MTGGTLEALCFLSKDAVAFCFHYHYYTEKNISEFFLFFIGILPQGIENRKIYCLKGSIYYCESEITG